MDAIDLDNHFPMRLAIPSADSFKPGLDFRLLVCCDMKAPFDLNWDLLKGIMRFEILF
ncbi:MAG: hypothetical protein MIO92_16085 [Methanosarcinaceae archaeon]|nr:hypothetical protein [Methanosarcinaceae archaeon]